jgi:hypothetical protein
MVNAFAARTSLFLCPRGGSLSSDEKLPSPGEQFALLLILRTEDRLP